MARLVQHKADFTMIGNACFRDNRLSYKAIGILAQLLSVDSANWNFSERGLAALHSDGRDSVRSALRELEEAGYLYREQKRQSDGKVAVSVYHVFAEPRTEGFDLGYEGFIGNDNSTDISDSEDIRNPSSEPWSENPTTGVTSKNTKPVDNFSSHDDYLTKNEQNPSSEPWSENPTTVADRGWVNRGRKIQPIIKEKRIKEISTPSHKGLVTREEASLGGVVGVDDFSETSSPVPASPPSAPSPVHVDELSDGELSSMGIERFNAGHIVGRSPKKKEFVNAVVDRELLDKALPASWLAQLPRNAQARLSRDITGWVAKGGNPSEIRHRLENDALPPVISNFSGLVIHRVSQALEAVAPLSREEKKQARRNEIRQLAEGVLNGDKRPSQRVFAQLSTAVSELNSSSDAELYGLVEQAYRKVSDNLYSHV
ncbi:MAG: helix-turn-helix domain-containing protein [Actinomycetaceae bacterium]|nr:helix-turn-helix domain-containing protein [Actinomycetaceae bacterium]